MKSQGENWSLFRLSDRKQFANVSLETIDFFFRASTEASRVDWLMWREGFSGWRPFGELASILKHLQTDAALIPSPPPVPDAVLKFAGEITGVTELTNVTGATAATQRIAASATVTKIFPLKIDPHLNGQVIAMSDEETLSLMLESQAATEDRNNARYTKILKVKIFTPTGVILAETIDCSTSGFRLKGTLPKGLPRFFHVEIDLGPDGKIPLVCSEVREKGGRDATRVRIQINDHFNVLKSALLRAA